MKRQQYFVWLLQDILYQAYMRAVEIGAQPALTETNYSEIFKIDSPDVSLRDNSQLADASQKLAMGFATLQNTMLGKSPTFHRIAVDLVLKFAGEPQADEILDKIIREVQNDPIQPVDVVGQPIVSP